jgi:HAD domain in Swiss Army Knife RNA repair proteins
MDPELDLLRGHEIQLWLNEYPDQVERYAILDDQEEEMLEDHMPNFFHASSETGLTQELADRIVAHLTGWRSSR